MGVSAKHYETFRNAARRQYVLEQREANVLANASFPLVAEYFSVDPVELERDRADDPAVNGDYEDPFGDLSADEQASYDAWNAGESLRESTEWYAEQAEIIEADDRARDYRRDI